MSDTSPIIDWSKHLQYPEDEIECVCGAVFRSYSKFVYGGDRPTIHTQKPCPVCGKTSEHVRRASSEFESWTI